MQIDHGGLWQGEERKGGESGRKKKSIKINVLGPEIARCGGVLPRQELGVRKFVPCFENFVFLAFRGTEPGMSQEFCQAVPDPLGCSEIRVERSHKK